MISPQIATTNSAPADSYIASWRVLTKAAMAICAFLVLFIGSAKIKSGP